jgi:hypothetical protein
MEDKESIFGPEFDQMALPRRRSLMPWWVKLFTWIFLVLGAISAMGFVAGFFGLNTDLSLYGLESNGPLSLAGLILLAIFLLKGITAFALWMEQDWAIHLGFADAILGILFCSFMMLVYPFLDGNAGGFKLRLELFVLVPYLRWLMKVKPLWERR